MSNNSVKRKGEGSLISKIIKWPQAGISIILIILFTLLALDDNAFYTASNMMNIARQTSLNIIIGIPITFTLAAGLLDLSIGSLACFGGILTCGLITGHSSATLEICPQLPFVLALIVSFIITGFFGYLNGLIITKLKLPPFIVTLAMQEIAKGAVLVFSRGFPVSNLPKMCTAFGRGTVCGIPNATIVMLVLLCIFWIILSKTKFGRHVYAVGGNTECARLSGINVNRVKRIIYVLNAGMAWVCGILVAFRLGSAQPDTGATYGMDAITACCLGGTAMGGGKGYMLGTVLGCLFLSCLSIGFNLMDVNTYWQQIIKGIILVFAITMNNRDQISFKRKAVKVA